LSTTKRKRATDAQLHALFAAAGRAGAAAVAKINPTPVQVVQTADPFDPTSPVVKRFAPMTGGVCGFAWVTIRPGNSRLARFAKKHYGARTDHYAGGVRINISQYGQSFERKAAFADAFAQVFRDAGYERVWSGSRID
jgi:hypothetical protein